MLAPALALKTAEVFAGMGYDFFTKNGLIFSQPGICIAYGMKNNYKNIQIVVTGNSGKTINAVSINNQREKMIFDAWPYLQNIHYKHYDLK